MTTPVDQLDLPELDLAAADRDEAIATYERLRREHWLVRIPMGYAVTRYEDVVAILRDRRFHSFMSELAAQQAPPSAAGGDTPRRQRSILGLEGAEHDRLRRLVAPAFTPRAADRLRPFMRAVVDDLVDPVAPTGRCELVEDVCEPYPIKVICELVGAPQDDWPLFSRWATDVFRVFNGGAEDDQELIVRALRALDEYVGTLVAERRARPAADLLSDLIAVEEAGDRLSTAELIMMVEAMLLAGTDTTRNQLACAVALLAEHPDQWALLAERPDLAARATEEVLRYLGTVRGTARIAAEDVDYRGVRFPKGTFVTTNFVVANRDPDVWDDPHRFDITRQPSRSPQLTFGSGIHVCLGAWLARAELQEALPILARRMPDLQVDGAVEWKPSTFGIWGPARLPLRFRPEPAS